MSKGLSHCFGQTPQMTGNHLIVARQRGLIIESLHHATADGGLFMNVRDETINEDVYMHHHDCGSRRLSSRGLFRKLALKVIEWIRKSVELGRNEVLILGCVLCCSLTHTAPGLNIVATRVAGRLQSFSGPAPIRHTPDVDSVSLNSFIAHSTEPPCFYFDAAFNLYQSVPLSCCCCCDCPY